MNLYPRLRIAARSLARTPHFTLIAIFAIATGIGMTTAVFTLVYGVLLRPLPYQEPDRLVKLWSDLDTIGESISAVSALDYRDMRDGTSSFEDLALAVSGENFGVQGILADEGVAPEKVTSARVSANFFHTLGVAPMLGRAFTADEERLTSMTHEPGSPPLPAIISYPLWQRRFGGDANIIGRRITVDTLPHEIVGVLPRDFRLLVPPDAHHLNHADLWKPLQIWWTNPMLRRTTLNLTAFGRLKSGITFQQAQAEVDAFSARLRGSIPEHAENGYRVRLVPLHDDLVRHSRTGLWTLLAATLALLLIACANIANLLLVRAAARRRELAIRVAIGASRLRIAGDVLAETLLLTLAGTVAGVFAARMAIDALISVGGPLLPRSQDVHMDWPVLAFAAGSAFIAAALFSLAPALFAMRLRSDELLRSGSWIAGTKGESRARFALIAFELALSVVLLTGAGLLVRSFFAIQRVQPGFDAAGVQTFQLSFPFMKYQDMERRRTFIAQLEERLNALPGVTAVGAISQMPLTGRGHFTSYSDPARPASEALQDEGTVTADYRLITDGYFRAVGTPLLAGRFFTPQDKAGSAPVVIIDRKIAEQLWPGENAVGKQLRFSLGRPNPVQTVIGVVEHARIHELTADGPGQIYVPMDRTNWMVMTFNLRTSASAQQLEPAIRDAVAALDPGLAPQAVTPMTHYLDVASTNVRFSLVLIQGIAAVALLMTAIGIYGVIAYATGRRVREFGIRLALGATPASLRRGVLSDGLKLAAVGAGAGLLVAVPVMYAARGFLYQVQPLDPLTMVVVAMLLGLVASASCYMPARRAAGVDPVESLRAE